MAWLSHPASGSMHTVEGSRFCVGRWVARAKGGDHWARKTTMPFAPDDVYVGMIAFFTVADLRRDRRIHTTTRTPR